MVPSAPSQNGSDLILAELVEEFTNRMQAGESVDVESYAQRHPECAERIRQLLPALALLAEVGRSGSPDPDGALTESREGTLAGTLGDFRILREVGRGGMGVVYEAEQISLRRRVALKVLPFAATMDSRHLQRFHNEAQAAACLHHTNIVPVFFVGCERGVHFYAMQFIDGQPLSHLIRQLRQADKKAPASACEEPNIGNQPPPGDAASTPLPAAEITAWTSEGRRSRDSFRKVAELGVQAAEALDHAHQLGIVHRDIKPANLLLDGRGNLWVTDFGLAHMRHGEANLTFSGQMVGTPRYMSPEQALAQRVVIDHRTDVYSLGASLYELLTLRPAFSSEDRQELLQQIAFEEPARLRRLERAIPAELEIIVLKAMEKRPQDRYATAQELADDLKRFLDHRPILARRPSLLDRAGKWTRRHRGVVVGAFAALLLTVGILSAAVVLVKQERDEKINALGERDTALETEKAAVGERDTALKTEKAALNRARANLTEANAQRKRAEEHLHAAMKTVSASKGFAMVLKQQGKLRSVANFLRGVITIQEKLLESYPEQKEYRRVLLQDYDALGLLLSELGDFPAAAEVCEKYVKLWNALGNEAVSELLEVTLIAAPYMLCQAYCRMSEAFCASGRQDRAEAAYREALRQLGTGAGPRDALRRLVDKVAQSGDLQPGEREALRQKQRSGESSQEGSLIHRMIAPGLLVNLGDVVADLGHMVEAEAHYREALALCAGNDLDLWTLEGLAHSRLGDLHFGAGKAGEAREAYRRALECWAKKPAISEWHLAVFLANCPDRSFRDAKRALELSNGLVQKQPQSPEAWRILSVAQYRAGKPGGAIQSLRERLKLGAAPQPVDIFLLAMALHDLTLAEAAGVVGSGNRGPALVVALSTRWSSKSPWLNAFSSWRAGVNRMARQNPKDRAVLRARAEAAALLGIKDSPAPSDKEGTPSKK